MKKTDKRCCKCCANRGKTLLDHVTFECFAKAKLYTRNHVCRFFLTALPFE